MYYYKKEFEGVIQYHACSHTPPLTEGLIEISREDYEAEMAKFFEEASEVVLSE